MKREQFEVIRGAAAWRISGRHSACGSGILAQRLSKRSIVSVFPCGNRGRSPVSSIGISSRFLENLKVVHWFDRKATQGFPRKSFFPTSTPLCLRMS